MNRLIALSARHSRWPSSSATRSHQFLQYIHTRLTKGTQSLPQINPKSQAVFKTCNGDSLSFLVKNPRRPLSTTATSKTPRTPPPGGRSAERVAELKKRNNNLLAWALALVLATVGMSYASVPLYRVFCQVTGFGGTVRTVKRVDASAPAKSKDKNGDDDDDDDLMVDENRVVQGRPLTIRFNADVSARVPWRFSPEQSQVVVLPGETALAFYLAENKSNEPITGIATYNITPAKAAIYFNKVQCFCFDEQRLKPGEKLDMPVFFFIDPDFADDSNMDDVKDIMLSYTFFKAEDVTPEQLLKAQAIAAGQT